MIENRNSSLAPIYMEKCISQRVEQLQKIPGLIPSYALAKKIEELIENCENQNFSVEYLPRKGNFLPCSIYCDRTKKIVHLKFKQILGIGGYNKVKEAVSLPYDNTKQFQLTAIRISKEIEIEHKDCQSKNSCSCAPDPNIEALYQIESEIEDHLKNEDNSALSTFLTVKPHRKYGEISTVRLTSIYPRFYGNLFSFNGTIQNKIEISIGILRHLEMIHKKNYIHNDLCMENCLWKNDIGVITDFGFSFESSTIQEHGKHLNWGLYPRYHATAPELLEMYIENKISSINPFRIELFAIGSALYQFCIEKQHSSIIKWRAKMDDIYDDLNRLNRGKMASIETIERDWRKCLLEKYQKECCVLANRIEDRYNELVLDTKEENSLLKRVEECILELMRKEPTDRSSLHRTIQRLNQLISSSSQL